MNVDFFLFVLSLQNKLCSWVSLIQTFHLTLLSFGFKVFIKLCAFLSQLNVFVLSDIVGLLECVT